MSKADPIWNFKQTVKRSLRIIMRNCALSFRKARSREDKAYWLRQAVTARQKFLDMEKE